MDFAQYSPVDNTPAAIRSALIRVTADTPKLAQQDTAAKAARDALLLTGDKKALADAETKLRTARDDAERMSAVADQLAQRLTAAERDEAIAGVNAARADVSNANQRANVFWEANGAKLRALLAEAADIVDARATAASRAKQAHRTAFDRFPKAGDQLALGINGTLLDEAVFADWQEVLGNANRAF